MDTAAALGAVVMVTLLVGVLGAAFWVWALVDLLRRPDAQWEVAGQSKVVWLLVLVLAGTLGALLYVLMARPNLRRLQAVAQVEFDPTAFGVPQDGMTYGEAGFQPAR
jgi:hypothetical protein